MGLITAFLFAISVSSCTFQLEGDYYNDEFDKVDLSRYTVSLNGANEPILVYKRSTLQYTFSTEFEEFLIPGNEVRVLIDGVEYREYYVDESTTPLVLNIDLDVSGLDEGQHVLSIEHDMLFTGPSLAGQIGVTTNFIGSWTLQVDKTPEPVNVNEITIQNGKLMLHWQEPKIKNFDSYFITCESENLSKSIKVEKNRNTTHFPYFLTGKAKFNIRTAIDHIETSVGNNYEFQMNEKLVEVNVQDSLVSLIIKKPTLHGNIKSFQFNQTIIQDFDFEYMTFELGRLSLLGQKMRADYSFTLGFEDDTESNSTVRGSVFGVLGEILPPHNNIVFSEQSNSFFCTRNGDNQSYLYKVNAESFDIDDTLLITNRPDHDHFGGLSLSANGKYIAIYNSVVNRAYVVDPKAFRLVRDIDLAYYYDFEPGNNIIKNRNGIIITNQGYLFLRGETYLIIDVNDLSMIYHSDEYVGWVGKNGDLSSDGSSLVCAENLYALNEDNYQLVNTLESEFLTMSFATNGRLLHFTDTLVHLRSLPSFEIINSFSLNTVERAANFGLTLANTLHLPKHERIITQDGGKLSVYNYQGEYLSSYTTSDLGRFNFLNGYLTSGFGQAIKLDIQ